MLEDSIESMDILVDIWVCSLEYSYFPYSYIFYMHNTFHIQGHPLLVFYQHHKHLYNIRSIGWDSAITPEGPVFIEGNDNWEIQSIHHRRGAHA